MGEALQDPEMVSSTLAAGCVHLAHELAFSPPVVVLAPLAIPNPSTTDGPCF